MNTNLLDLNDDILEIIGGYVKIDNIENYLNTLIMLIEWKRKEWKNLNKLMYYMIY